MPRSARRHIPAHVGGRPVKITFGAMRAMGLRGVLVYCHCGHHVALSADRWPDDVRLSDIEPRFVCGGCGSRGAEVRPDFASGRPPQFAMSKAR
ncbi:hypothetical protein [Bradyrhizobium zhanjiangense]|uniref:Uncharacterized protein n=1 Tax=Bradyrhizobium zhanjiangense TaxID=1325107 RepID=A0A4Q0QED2_9BRAD|nr:hypothetical protein [Bradyrhizobium zhanjiangense]RXG88725.1 hypothetical protein EAS61_29095 [Bradyrhizobium zhanjiangense]RXG96375.1 hypothetical protein EAS62_12365 [Bradyrhizobium zhanjiangense]